MSGIDGRTQLAAAAALTPVPSAQPAKAADAARQFEGLLIAQMLRSIRESSGGDDDSTDSPMIDLAEQHFSRLLANNGGLGLAKLVIRGLQSGNP